MNTYQNCLSINKFLSEFQIISHTPESTIISSSTNTYLIRNIQIQSTQQNKVSLEQINEIIQTLTQHQQFNNKNIYALLDFEIINKKNKQNKGEVNIRAIYEYGMKSLEQEIEKRKQTNFQKFQQDALWGLLYSLATPLDYLQNKNIIYGVLDASRIFLDKNISLLDPSSTALDPYQITEGRLYSPQLLIQQRQIQQIDMFKSDVFVLGLIMLQSALLRTDSFMSNNQSQIQECLDELEYSEQFKEILLRMLANEPEERPSFYEILKILSDMFEISTTEVENIEPLKNDDENAANELFSHENQVIELQVIDILVDEGKQQNQEYQMLTEYQRTRLKFLGISPLKQNKYVEILDEDSIELSANTSCYIDEVTMKSLQKSKRVSKPKQIKDKLIKHKEMCYHTEHNDMPSTFSAKTRHQRSNTYGQMKQNNTKNVQIFTSRVPSHDPNDKNKQNILANKQNLFTRPQIMSMIKNNIKRIEQRKRTSNLQLSNRSQVHYGVEQ